MREKIERVLREEVEPMLARHGGSVQLVDVTGDGEVKVCLSGACAGCPGARMTLTHLVENAIKARVPEVKKVEAID